MIEWISVDDRLPENGDDIIMCFDDGGVALGTYDPETGDWFWLKNKEDYLDVTWVVKKKVTYWMPLPEPPEK